MKTRLITLLSSLVLVANSFAGDEKITVVAPTTEAGEGLDLQAVAELFKESKTVEEFERELNDPRNGINNLDLNEDGYIDFIRVVDYADRETHVFILQVPLGENEYQDVATIEIERENDTYNLQIRGNVEIYGPDYYYHAPVRIHVHLWPIVTWVYGPRYRPYRSVYYWGHYPVWWRPWRPVSFAVYKSGPWRRHYGRTTFVFGHKTHVHSARNVYRKPSSSHRAVRKNRAGEFSGRYSWKHDRKGKPTTRRGGESGYARDTEHRRRTEFDRKSETTQDGKSTFRSRSNVTTRKSYGSRADRRQGEPNRAEVRKSSRSWTTAKSGNAQRVARGEVSSRRTEGSARKSERKTIISRGKERSSSRSFKRSNGDRRTQRSESKRR